MSTSDLSHNPRCMLAGQRPSAHRLRARIHASPTPCVVERCERTLHCKFAMQPLELHLQRGLFFPGVCLSVRPRAVRVRTHFAGLECLRVRAHHRRAPIRTECDLMLLLHAPRVTTPLFL